MPVLFTLDFSLKKCITNILNFIYIYVIPWDKLHYATTTVNAL